VANPWDYGNGYDSDRKETMRAYQAFRFYLEIGSERTIKKTAETCGSGIGYEMLRHYAKRFAWSKRASAYDAHIIDGWGLQVRNEFEATHKEALMKFRVVQQQRAEGLGRVADLLIVVSTTTLQQMVAQESAVEPAQLAAIARTAAALAEAAMNTGAAALGVDDLIEAINPEAE
jgi:hypothetical protein